MTMLALENVEAGYGDNTVLKGFSLAINAGEIVTLIGANGSGKSTTLMTISGLVRPQQGRVIFEGEDISRLAPSEIVSRGISQVPEGRRVLPRLTVAENLELGAYLRRDRAEIVKDHNRVMDLFPILGRRRQQLAGTLSGGEQQMLAIARGLMARPKLLLLDEPSLGLAPKMVLSIFDTIPSINQAGMTLLFVEQSAYLALQVAHRGYVLETGRIVLTDSAKALSTNPKVKAAYLGG